MLLLVKCNRNLIFHWMANWVSIRPINKIHLQCMLQTGLIPCSYLGLNYSNRLERMDWAAGGSEAQEPYLIAIFVNTEYQRGLFLEWYL